MHLVAYSGKCEAGQIDLAVVNTQDQDATLVLSNVQLAGDLAVPAYFVDFNGDTVWGQAVKVGQAKMWWGRLPADKLGRVVLQPANMPYAYAVVYSPKA